MITGRTQVLALFGDPVIHSMSPQMHAGWIADHGIDACYVALRLDPATVHGTFAGLGGVGLRGANVTAPFKEQAARAARMLDPAARALGAANTLHWRDDGGFDAYNTDAPGFVAALDEAAPDWRARTRRVALVGAGGAAKGIAWGLLAAGVEVVEIVNRSAERAEDTRAALAASGGRAVVVPWGELGAAFARADLIVNAATLGMTGKASMDWPIEMAQPHAIVVDAVYAPLETDLLRRARARGLTAVDGLGMLIHQGAIAFEIWFGVRPDAKAARARLLPLLEARR